MLESPARRSGMFEWSRDCKRAPTVDAYVGGNANMRRVEWADAKSPRPNAIEETASQESQG